MKRSFTVSKRYRLSKKEAKRLRKELETHYPHFNLDPVGSIEYAKVGRIEFFVIDGIPAFYRDPQGDLIPTLIYLIKRGYSWLPWVKVDRGATRAVSRGADLMVPGIVEVSTFDKGSIVAVVDAESGVAVAVGRAVMSSEEIMERLAGERRGKAIKNLHHPGDDVWEASKALL
ncbi:MAG: DUF1947 domain-containing protein [Desulfurococcales archaeon]|nr:DUF1947 domain-containing protein [Desulfurococcales archaeon]